MSLQAQDRVVITEPQLHGNQSVLLDGEIISIEGSRATVSVDHETVPRSIPISALSKSDAMYGDDTGRPNELPVFNAIRS